MIRKLTYARLKEDCLDEYIQVHQHVWPELVEEMTQYGLISVSSFINGLDLYVYLEYTETWEQNGDALPVNSKWQKYMKGLTTHLNQTIEFKEVYHFANTQITDQQHPTS